MPILCGIDVFRQYAESPDPVMTGFLQNELLSAGLQRAVRPEGDTKNVKGQRLPGENGVLYLILNHAEETRHFSCTLQESSETFIDIRIEKTYPTSFETTLPAISQMVLCCSCPSGIEQDQ